MTTYLSRPVFDFPVDWSRSPAQSFSYDLRELTLAQAAPRYQALQSFTTRGFSFELLLAGEAEIAAFDAFTTALQGRVNGFWMPSPFAALEIDEVQDGDHFHVKGANLGDYSSADASQYLVFTKSGSAPQFAKITSVTPDDGRELMALDATLSGLDASWDVARLLYVRLASDEESAEFIADNMQRRAVRVVELPLEYAEIETGQQPVFLYEFKVTLGAASVVYLRTGLNENIDSAANGSTLTYHSKPITHRGPRQTLKAEGAELSIETVFGDEPFAHLTPFLQPLNLQVRVWETSFADPDTALLLFTGQVENFEANGRKLTLKCLSRMAVAGRKFPRMLLQPRCNYAVFSRPCGLDKDQFKAAGTVASVTGNEIAVSLSDPPISGKPESAVENYFALGWCEYTNTNNTPEARHIVKSTAQAAGQMTLTLSIAPNVAGGGSVAITLYPGCDGHKLTCKAYNAGTNPMGKFNNFARWGGQNTPTRNPAIRAIQVSNTSGAKK